MMDHFQQPRNGGPLSNPDRIGFGSEEGRAPRVAIYLRLASERVAEARFTAFGCGVTIAAASCLTELALDKSREECLAISTETLSQALDGVPSDRSFALAIVVQALHDAWQDPPLKVPPTDRDGRSWT